MVNIDETRLDCFFENWQYSVLLTLPDLRGGVLTLTDPRTQRKGL